MLWIVFPCRCKLRRGDHRALRQRRIGGRGGDSNSRFRLGALSRPRKRPLVGSSSKGPLRQLDRLLGPCLGPLAGTADVRGTNGSFIGTDIRHAKVGCLDIPDDYELRLTIACAPADSRSSLVGGLYVQSADIRLHRCVIASPRYGRKFGFCTIYDLDCR